MGVSWPFWKAMTIIFFGLEDWLEICHVHYVRLDLRQAVGLLSAALFYRAERMTYCWLENIWPP